MRDQNEDVVELAKHVWARHMAYTEAMRTRDIAAGDLLRALVISVRPALSAIVGGINNGADLDVAAGQSCADGNLWIHESGSFFSVHGGVVSTIDCDEAANVWGVDYIANALVVLFQGQLNGKKTKRTNEIIAERDQLLAILTLLRGKS